MNRMRKNLAVLCAVMLIPLAVACVRADTPPATPTPKATAGAAAGASADKRWEQTVGAARQEGRVVVYGEIVASVRDAIAKGIGDKYGIEAEFVTGKGAEVAQKFLAERTANLNLADAFVLGGGTLILILKPKGVLSPIPPIVYQPEAVDPRAWSDGSIPYLDKDKLVLPLGARYSSFVLRNTDMVKDGEIKSYDDLLDRKWKGKMTMIDPTVTGTGSSWTTFILTRVKGPEKGKQYLKQMAEQDLNVIKDTRLHVEWVGRGKYPIGLGPHFATVTELQEAGVPIAWVPVQEGGLMAPGAGVYAIPDKPAHPNASALLTNWLLTAEGQLIFSRAFGNPAIRLDVSKEGFDPLTIPRPGEKVYWNDEDFVLDQPKAIETGKDIFGPLMR